jgi:S1-C subfamily serine protease
VDGGVMVAGMSPLSPARAAGLRAGDVIVQLNGRPVASREEFYRELWQAPMDQDVGDRAPRRRDGGHRGPADGSLPFLSDLRQVG